MAARRHQVVLDSDDEDDVTLAQLAAKNDVKPAPGSLKPAAAASSGKSKSSSARKPKRPASDDESDEGDDSAEEEEEEEEEDEKPRKEKKPAKKAPAKTSASSSAKRAKPTPTPRAKSPASSASSSKKYAEVVINKQGGRELDKDWPIKHQAVEAVLCRWQYSGFPYPPPDLDLSPPSGFMPLVGVPGVFVGVAEEVLGEIIDRRPKEPRPSVNFLLTISSEKLALLYRQAVEGQLRALMEKEGEEAQHSRLGRALTSELSRAVVLIEKLASKLDQQAAKHEETSGNAELADKIRRSSGDEALRRAGGIRAMPPLKLKLKEESE